MGQQTLGVGLAAGLGASTGSLDGGGPRPSLIVRKSVCDLSQMRPAQTTSVAPVLVVDPEDDAAPSGRSSRVEQTHSGHIKLTTARDEQLKSRDNLAVLQTMLVGDSRHSLYAPGDSGSPKMLRKSNSRLDIEVAEVLQKRPSLIRLDSMGAASSTDSRRSSSLAPPDSRRGSTLPPPSSSESRRGSTHPPPASATESRRSSSLAPPQNMPGSARSSIVAGSLLVPGTLALQAEPVVNKGRSPSISVPQSPGTMAQAAAPTVLAKALGNHDANEFAASTVDQPEERTAREQWRYAIKATLVSQKIKKSMGDGAGVPGNGPEDTKKNGAEYLQKTNKEELLFLTRQLALNKPITDFIAKRDRGANVSAPVMREYLKRLTPFKKFNNSQLDKLAMCMQYEYHGKDRAILRQGHVPTNAYVLLSGEVSIAIKKKAGEKEQVVNSLRAGQGFGELAILRFTTRGSTVVTTMWSEFLRIHKDDFCEILALDPTTSGATTIAIMERARKVPIFADLVDDSLMKIAVTSEIIEVQPGQVVIKQDELEDRCIYIVLQGQLFAHKTLAATPPDDPRKRPEASFEILKLEQDDFFPSLRTKKVFVGEAFLEEFELYFKLLTTGYEKANVLSEKFKRLNQNRTANVTVKAKTKSIVLRCQRLELLRVIADDVYACVKSKGYAMEVTEEELEKQYENTENWEKYRKEVRTELYTSKK